MKKLILAALSLSFSGGCSPQVTSEGPLSNGYSIDGDSVYYRDYKLDVDPEGFEVLNEHWIKNAQHVFFMFTPRTGQELRTGAWSQGEDGDFYRLNTLLGFFARPVDVQSFELLTDYLAADKSQVYYFNTNAPVNAPSVLNGADPKSLSIIDEHYAQDRSQVFYTRRHSGPCTLDKADPVSFTVLNERYAKDAQHVFYECALVEGADAASFEVTSGWLAKDSDNAYRSGRLVADANPATFRHLKHQFSNLNFYADEQHVYYLQNKIEGADPGTFEVIGSYFSRDQQHAYFCSRKCHKIDGADSNTFRVSSVVSNWANARVYAQDANNVFFCAELEDERPCAPLPDADPNSFTYIGKFFSRDVDNVFFRAEVVEGAHAASFEMTAADDHSGQFRARDNNSTYVIQRVGAPTFYEFKAEAREE